MVPPSRIAIIGAGIAGMSTAIAALRHRHAVQIFDDLASAGDGSVLLLWPNAMKAARALGIENAVHQAGTIVQSTVFKNWKGSVLWRLRVPEFQTRYGAVAVLISRESLIRVLTDTLSALGSPVVRAKCVGFSQFGGGVHPSFAPTRATGVFDALVGCDGIDSVVRMQLRPKDGRPRTAHHSAWIGLSDVSKQDWKYDIGHTVTFLGHGVRFCASTMKEAGRGNTRLVYWYATESISRLGKSVAGLPPGEKLIELLCESYEETGSWIRLVKRLKPVVEKHPALVLLLDSLPSSEDELDIKDIVERIVAIDTTGAIVADLVALLESSRKKALSVSQLIELFATVDQSRDQVASLIEKSRSNLKLSPRRIPVRDRLPVRRWTDGRVTLLGDAAHPSTPDLGQGACQALEGAAVLGHFLAESATIPQAFRRYEHRRIDRAARVTEMSRLTAVQSMVRSPGAEHIREFGVRTLLPAITSSEFDSLFSIDFD